MNSAEARPDVTPSLRANAPRLIRPVLGALLAFGALNAFGGGYYGLSGAPSVPTSWLASSPFRDYFVPSFILFVVVGGSMLTAALAVFARAAYARRAATLAGVVVLGWIAVQVAIIGYVSWMQPTTAAAGLFILGMAQLLPHGPAARRAPPVRSLAGYYLDVIAHPRAAFDALVEDARRLPLGALALLATAALYTIVYVFLVMGGGRPTVFKPWLAIDAEAYYRYDVFFVAPSMLMAWILAGGVVQLLARGVSGKGTFEDTLSVLGFGIALSSWWTLLHDLVTSFLGAFHVIDQRAYEDAMSSPTVFRTVLWTLMAGYLVSFLVLFAKGIGAAQRVSPRSAAVLAVVAFAVYQGVFLLFNR